MQEQGQDPAGVPVPAFSFSGVVDRDQVRGAALSGGEGFTPRQHPPAHGGGQAAQPGRVEDVDPAASGAGGMDVLGQVQPGRGGDQGAGGVQAMTGERDGLSDPGSSDPQGGVFAGRPDTLPPPTPTQPGDLHPYLPGVQVPPLLLCQSSQGWPQDMSLEPQRRGGGVLGDIQAGRDPARPLVQISTPFDQRFG